MVTRATSKEGARDIANLESKSTERASYFCKECFRRMPLDAYRIREHLCAVCDFESRCEHTYQMTTLDSTGPNTPVWECVRCGHREPVKGITRNEETSSNAELAAALLDEMEHGDAHLHSDDFIPPSQKIKRLSTLLLDAPIPTVAEASVERAHDFFEAYRQWVEQVRREIGK